MKWIKIKDNPPPKDSIFLLEFDGWSKAVRGNKDKIKVLEGKNFILDLSVIQERHWLEIPKTPQEKS